ncbi:conserved oligomeric Golgi complex subunit 2 [Anthonomus grandis grandis]|uniref:conserved oligomeric Golgi complex subunit 2 n=1 Tax=Anthonomus grandis grandis TaxID=2921223 RepID=UPI0021655186|nr:conserved oligomeric Golgi complex subunit 2 [Anthonomus grandis grandis]
MDWNDVQSWRHFFFKDTFSVDQCLSQYIQKSDLESLRADLKNYGIELQHHMAEILKNETENIVVLAEYLTNLNKKIEYLFVPISQLHEEVRTLHHVIDQAARSYEYMLNDIKKNNSKENHGYLQLNILNTSVHINTVIRHPIRWDEHFQLFAKLSGDKWKNFLTFPGGRPMENFLTLDRIVNQYSFQKLYLDQLGLMTPQIEKIVRNIETMLLQNINFSFITSFNTQYSDGLLRCLRMYSDLQKHDVAYETFQCIILRPSLRSVFVKYGEDGVIKAYEEIKKDILDNKVEELTKVIKNNQDLCCFNFVLESFWKEFDSQSREIYPNITAPGYPELFQRNFTGTYKLLAYISEKAGDKDLIKEDKSFQHHLKRFNLPVYFEIVFQQIAGKFESETLNLGINNYVAGNSNPSFRVRASVALWHAFKSCFHESIYIEQLADSFVKMSFMLLSRYIRLLENVLKETSYVANNDNITTFIIDVLTDLKTLHSLIMPRSEFQTTIYAVINLSLRNFMFKIFKAYENSIIKIQNYFKMYISTAKRNDCTSALQNITAIPRLYRRTNRTFPREASAYMIEAVKPILIFEQRYKSTEELGDIVDGIILEITNQYFSLVQEVLRSVCKTEESLRRLKSRTLNTSSDDLVSPTETITDEAKIREQIKYDVGYFCDKLHPLATDHTRQAMLLLKKEVGMS